MRLSVADVPDYLHGKGLVSKKWRSDAVASRLSGRNFSASVRSAGSPSFFVKQSSHRHVARSPLFKEAAFYRLSARIYQTSDARFSTPRLVHYDEENDVLILELLGESEDLERFHQAEGCFPSRIAQDVAVALAGIHDPALVGLASELRQQMPADSSAVPVFSYHLTPEDYASLESACRQFMALIQRDIDICEALDEVCDNWDPIRFTHQDFRFANLMSGLAVPNEVWGQVTIVDWEECSLGDPAWDVGVLIGEYLRCWLFSIRLEKSKLARDWFDNAETQFSSIVPAIREFWLTYVEHAEIEVECRRDFLSRSLRYSAAYLLERCYLVSQGKDTLSPLMLCILQVSRNILLEPRKLGRMIGI